MPFSYKRLGRHQCLTSLGLGLISLWACREPPQPAPTPVDEAAFWAGDTLRLDEPIRALAPNLTGREASIEYGQTVGFLADAAIFGGSVAILDRMAPTIGIFSRQDGGLLRRIGREGEGPGEFRSPMALAASDSTLAVWDEVGRLLTYDAGSGQSLATALQPVRADWREVVRRYPGDPWMSPYQHSDEFHLLRLQEWEGDFLLLLTAHDEATEGTFDYTAPGVNVIRFDRDLNVVDTVLSLSGPPMTRMAGGGVRGFGRQVYASDPLFAAGEGWMAVRETGSAIVHVEFAVEREPPFVIDLSVEVRAITEEDQFRYMENQLRGYAERGEEDVRRAAQARSREMSRSIQRNLIPSYQWAKETPAGTALHSAGDCLLIVGFDNRDGNHRFHSQEVLVVDVQSRAVEGVLILDDGELLMAGGPEGILVHRYDSITGESRVHEMLPDWGCHGAG